MGSLASVSLARLTPSRDPKTRRLRRVEIVSYRPADRTAEFLRKRGAN